MPKPKKRRTIKIRPVEVTLANGAKARASIPYPPRGRTWRLPAEGATVPEHGREGSFWKRRLAEGAVEVVNKPSTATTKKGGE